MAGDNGTDGDSSQEHWTPSEDELQCILDKHRQWVDTEGEEGVRVDLGGANLQGVTGLQAHQLRGADVSNAELPEAISKFEGLGIVKEASQSARKLFISMLVACGYSVLTVLTVATAGEAGSEETVTLPILGVELELALFYLVGSGLLALLFGYFHLQMQHLWEELADLPARFPDGRPLDRKITPWLITRIVRAHVKLLKEQSTPPFFLIQRGVAVILAWVAVPFTLVVFAYNYSHNRWWSAFLYLLAAATTGFAAASWRKATQTLQHKKHRPLSLRRPDSSEGEKWFVKSPSFWISVALLLLTLILWYVRHFGLGWLQGVSDLVPFHGLP